MTLSSPSFLLFMLAAAVAYFTVPRRLQNPVLLLANLLFYLFAGAVYLPLLAVVTAGSFFLALAIHRRETGRGRLAGSGAALLVALLALFKYAAAPLGTLLARIPLLAPSRYRAPPGPPC